MKFFAPKFLTVLLLLFAFNAKATNDTLTIGQAFNWKIGDSLVYRPYRWCYINITFWYEPFVAFTVLDKQVHSDSIIYSILQSSGYHDTVIFSNKDSSLELFNGPLNFMGGCQFYGDSLPNFQHWEYYYTDSLYPEVYCFYHHVNAGEYMWDLMLSKTVGIIHREQSAKEYCGPGNAAENQGGCGVDLVYYKSDSIIWIDSARYFYTSIFEPNPAPTFRVFPNPASDELTITTQTDEPFDVSVYDLLGNCVLARKNFKPNLGNLNLNTVPPGYYLLKLTDRHGLSASKGFIIAR